MSGQHDQCKGPAVLLVEPPAGELERLAQEIPGWDLAETDGSLAIGDAVQAGSATPSAVIVFARKDEEPHALEVCRRIRGMERYRDVPLLVAITIYQMPLGNDVKRLRNANFIFTPIKKRDLSARVGDMTGSDMEG